jgi:hypothetical protein
MSELEIFQAVNKTKTAEELKQVIIDAFPNGVIMGRDEPFQVREMNQYIDMFVEDFPGYVTGDKVRFRALPTRQYGIRQQLCYILLNPHR